MSLKLVAIVSALLLALCLSKVLGAATTVRPYKFGFTIDEQQHRQEKRDERGIVMGEFGFITADGIYHVTVYATDEEGKFRIISMKSYPYNGPIGSKSVPAATTPRASLPASPAPPRYNFNTEACSGCFLKKTPVKTEIRTLSQPLAPAPAGKPSDQGLNVQLPFRDSIAQTVATQLGLGQVTQHTTHTYTTPSAKTPVKDIEAGVQLAMATYYESKAAVTGHVSTQTGNSRSPSSTKVDYNVGVIRKAGPVTYAPLNTRLSEDAIRSASTSAGQITAPLALEKQPLVAPAAVPAGEVKIFAVDGHNNVPSSSNMQAVGQRPSFNVGNALRGGVASAKRVSGSKPARTTQYTTLAHNPLSTPSLNSATSTGNSGVAGQSATGRAPSYNNGGAVAGAAGGSFPLGKSPVGGASGKPQFGSAGKGGVSGVSGGSGGSGSPGGLGGSGKSGVSGVSGAPGAPGASGGSGSSGASGSAFGASGGIGGGATGRGSGSGTVSRGETGDLYKFKYLLDYNGHEETGSRNGDKQGSYFAIGEDAVQRTIEYIANEFGFQPHVSWKKLDEKAALPEENSLKHYEFKWFN